MHLVSESFQLMFNLSFQKARVGWDLSFEELGSDTTHLATMSSLPP
jgi:hypothetical protein